jgi:hypothetical protein
MVSLARSHGRGGFAKAVGTSLLLVRLDDPNGDFALTLEAALEDAPTSGGFRPDPNMGFETVVGSLADSTRTADVAARRAPGGFKAEDLYRQLVRAVHFAVPLCKRRGATNIFADRISVGRARTNDVVLRHHSVSKFHAWFECDEDGRFYLCDAKSTNATLVNGVQIPKSSPMQVEAGDEVRFGDVVTVFCPPEVLWDALIAAAPPSGRAPAPPSGRAAPPSNKPGGRGS